MVHAFIYGIFLAFGLIMPLGIQNIFLFNQGATQKHFLHALPSVITASICDMALITLAVSGVSIIVFAIPILKLLIFLVGFFFLMYMGFVTWKTQPKKLQEGHKPLSAKKQIAFSASVSLLNPHAIMDSVAIIGTNSLQFTGYEKLSFTLACIIISCIWFLGMSLAGHFLHRLDKKGIWILMLNKISAIIIWAVALYMGVMVVESLS